MRSAARVLGPRLPPLDVHCSASRIWSAFSGGRGTKSEHARDVIRHAAASRSSASVRVLRALSAVAPAPYGDLAAEGADRLVAAGHPEPPWADAVAAPVELTGAAIFEDPVDDDAVCVMAGFDGAVGAHTIGVWIDHNLAGPAIDARCFPDPFDKAFDDVERQLPARTVIRRIEGAEAAARWRAAVEMTDTTFDSLVDDSMRALRALVLARGPPIRAPLVVLIPDVGTLEQWDQETLELHEHHLGDSDMSCRIVLVGIGPRYGRNAFNALYQGKDTSSFELDAARGARSHSGGRAH